MVRKTPTNVWHVGLCNGRHTLTQNPKKKGEIGETGEVIKNFIFPEPVPDPLDIQHFRQTCGKWIESRDWIFTTPYDVKVYLYVTGLTPLLTAFLSCWLRLTDCTPALTLMHYNTESGEYDEEMWP